MDTHDDLQSPNALSIPWRQESLDLLAQRIAELLAQSEALGEAGDVDAAQAVVAQADTLKVPTNGTYY